MKEEHEWGRRGNRRHRWYGTNKAYLQEKSTQGDPNKLVTKVMGRKDTKVHTEQIVKEMISEGRIKRRHERE